MDSHPPCGRCRTTDPDAFDSPTSAYCRKCWAWQMDPDRRFREWAESAQRSSTRLPFFIRGSS